MNTSPGVLKVTNMATTLYLKVTRQNFEAMERRLGSRSFNCVIKPIRISNSLFTQLEGLVGNLTP
jgi:hypothetical protein